MSRRVMAVSLLVAVGLFAVLPSRAAGAQDAQSATEQTPDASSQGKTSNLGPQKMFDNGAKSETAQPQAQSVKPEVAENKAKAEEAKAQEKAEKEKAKEAKKQAREAEKQTRGTEQQVQSAEHPAPIILQPGETVDEGLARWKKEQEAPQHYREAAHAQPAESVQGDKEAERQERRAERAARKAPQAEMSAEAAARVAAEARERELAALRQRIEFENRMHTAIRNLGNSGWREAQVQLVSTGKAAIPFLIEAMGGEMATVPAYNLGGHTKADTGRASRQRPIAEVCSELLTDIVSNHSDYRGPLPTLDQKAWQEWWTENAGKVTFAN